MTKSEYRKYIQSEHWIQRRKMFLLSSPTCNRCRLPRWMSVIAYDQDLHVHHKNYQNIGAELDSDLEVLCRRCHEVETFGESSLQYPVLISLEQVNKYTDGKSDDYLEGWNDAIEWYLYMRANKIN